MLLFSHSPSAWCSVLRNITKRAKRTNRLADKLRGRGAAHDPTAWFAERTTLGLGSYCLTTCTYPDDSQFVLGMSGHHPNTFRMASVSSVILTLSDGLLRGPSTKRAKRTNRRSRQTQGTRSGP